MSLNLKPDIEARLIALAQAGGVSVEDFLLHVVEEKAAQVRHGSVRNNGQRSLKLGPIVFPEAAPIPDEALGRENLYPDRW
jgi:hypothetical protein